MVGPIRPFLAALLFCFSVAQTQPLAPTREAQDFTVAYGLYKDGQYQLAYEEFQRFLTRYPASTRRPEASYLSAETLIRLGRNDEATERLERFIRENRGSRMAEEAELRLGELAVGHRDFSGALKRLQPIIARGPAELAGEAAYWCGEAWFGLEQKDSALTAYRRSIAVSPAGRLAEYSWYSIAWVKQRSGDLAGAAEAYSELQERYPKGQLRSRAAVRAGEVRMLAGENEKAIAHLERVRGTLDTDDDRAEALYLLGESCYRRGMNMQARAWYDSLLTLYPGHRLVRDARYARAWTLLNERKHAEAASAFLALGQGNDHTAEASLFRAGVSFKLAGKPADAASIFRKSADRPGSEFADDALVELGVLRYDAGQLDSALAFFQRVVVGYPAADARPRALFMTGEVYRTRERFEEALAAYRDARAQTAMTPELLADILFEEGLILERLGRHDEAIAILHAFITEFPKDPQAGDAWFWLGEAAFHAEDFARADSAYTHALHRVSGERAGDALYGSAWSKFRQGEYKQALSLFTQLIASHPQSRYVADARLRKADCCVSLGDHRSAIAAYRDVLKLDKTAENLEHAHYHLGGALVRSGQTAPGIKEYEALLSGFPRSPLADDARYAIGWVYFQQKNYTRAMQEFRTALRTYPRSDIAPRILCSLGDAQYNTGDYTGAASTYAEVLNAHPENAAVVDAARGVRDSYAALGKTAEGDAAVATFLKRNPDAPVADRLAFEKADELAQNGENDAAARAYEEMIRTYPSSALLPSALLGAGRARLALGDEPAADKHFRMITDRFPRSSASAEALLQIGRSLAGRKQLQDAIAIYERIERDHPGTSGAGEARLERARVLSQSGDADAALKLLAATPGGPDSGLLGVRSRLMSADILRGRKDLAQADEIYALIASQRSDDAGAEAQCGVGEIQYAQGKTETGIAAFARVRYLYPASREWIGHAAIRMGDGYALLGQKDKAREQYGVVIQEHGDDDLGRSAAERSAELP
jgi:TolA-binding protein